jgi:hypothetical protein
MPENKPSRPSLLISWRWPLAVILICLFPLIAFWLLLRESSQAAHDTVRHIGQGIDYAVRKAESIAEKFKQGKITTTFVAAIPQISGTGIGNLELATASTTETFRREDSLSIFGDRIPLGTTISEIRVPVTYRYHLRLSDPWRLEVSNQTCIVHAPRIRPSLPPAIDTERMEKKSEAGWARFNKQEQLDELEKNVTPTLKLYSRDPKHLSLVREECRKTVAEFVKKWLLREEQWRQDRFHTIKVIFADEKEAAPAQLEPTLKLNE